MRDSPMWKRGKRSRSNNSTFRPCCARRVDTVLPAGPPPITTTSVVRSAMFYLRVCRSRSAPGTVGALVGKPGGAEEGDEGLEVLAGQVAELPGVAVADRLPHFVQQGDAGG